MSNFHFVYRESPFFSKKSEGSIVYCYSDANATTVAKAPVQKEKASQSAKDALKAESEAIAADDRVSFSAFKTSLAD